MDPNGYYRILKVPENATHIQIKLAYRSIAMRYHPDKNKSSTADDMMKKINEAYEVLSDKQKRQEYDNIKDIKDNFKTPSYNVHYNYASNNKDKKEMNPITIKVDTIILKIK